MSCLLILPWKTKDPRSKTFREVVQFYMIDFQTPLGKAIDLTIISLNLLLVAIFVINTYSLPSDLRDWLWRLEMLIVAIFVIEYVLRFYGSPNRRSYVKDIYSIIDLVAIMPTILLLILSPSFFVHDIRVIQTIRVLAVFRIFRFLRFIADYHLFFGIIGHEMINVARLVVTIIIIIFFVYSGFFYYVESPVNPLVQNFGDAFYFTVVAVSTVGFGDIVPVSGEGRLVTLAMIISGIILIPFHAARIFRTWLRSTQEKKALICQSCGLDRHDLDAKYCKNCGSQIFDENSSS